MQLEIKSLSKSYGDVKALTEVNLVLNEGVYGLLGPNGSGKTTLINIITDNLRYDSGKILYNGTDTLELGVNFRSIIGFMPQYTGLYPNFTVEAFLKYIGALKGLSVKETSEQLNEVLDAVSLSDIKRRKIKTLSGGMKQRLSLAQAIMGNPKILILDEPTAGLDPSQRISIRNYISKISGGKIILLATHAVPDVESIAKKIIFLKEGVVAACDTPENLTSKMNGKVWSATVPVDEIEKYNSRYLISGIKTEDGRAILKIVSDTKPEIDKDDATLIDKTSLTLEDCYLWHFGNLITEEDK